MRTDPGSFRDRRARVFHHEGRVYRALRADARADWEAFAATPLWARWTTDRRLVPTRAVPDADRPPLPDGDWSAVLEHDPWPVFTFAHEWPFGLLQAAALFYLDLTLDALESGFELRDAVPHNIQFLGVHPTLLDVGSLARRTAAGGWNAYGEFCRRFLFPLLLEAHRGVAFQPWLRGAPEGLSAEETSRFFTWADWRRPGVLKDVVLPARLEALGRGLEPADVAARVAAAVPLERVRRNVQRLRAVVEALRPRAARSPWRGYDPDDRYTAEDRREKMDFTARALEELRPRRVWDMGSHLGEYAARAARGADVVLALDADSDVAQAHLERVRGNGPHNVTPLVVDVVDPSPPPGWRDRERPPLAARAAPDLVLALALAHHVVIGRNVPLDEWVESLAELGAPVVLEFPGRDDPSVQALLGRKTGERFDDYDLPRLRAALTRRFETAEEFRLPSGRRTLFRARPRAGGGSAR